MKLDSLKVVLATSNISALVQGMTLYESINGFVKGNIQILDGINFFDDVIGGNDQLISSRNIDHLALHPIEITYFLGNVECTNHFVMDGVNQMKINKSDKEYVIHLISPVEHSLKLTKINHVYEGPSHKIVQSIFEESTGFDSKLVINTIATTKGKYIVPNISAKSALSNVIGSAVDADHAGFYLYQRVSDWGATRLASIRTMAKDFFKNDDGNDFQISNNLPDQKQLNNTGYIPGGTSNNFTMTQYKMHHTNKLADGQYGNKIHHVRLDETKVKKNEPVEQSRQEITTYKISDKLYNTSKSLFTSNNDPSDVAAINQKKRIHNTALSVSNMSPLPYIGCGNAVRVKQGGSNISRTIADGPYIISNINHIFQTEDNGINYTQNMSLIREYA
jgi:hypothetical protein